MKKFVEIISLIFISIKSLLVFAGITGLGLLFYDFIKGIGGIVTLSIFSIGGIYFGYQVFIVTWRRGIIEMATVNSATSDFDNLLLSSDSNVKLYELDTLRDLIDNGGFSFTGGQIRIWGDYRSRSLDNFNHVASLTIPHNDQLIINFKDNRCLTIINPRRIYLSESFLKINEANKVKWEWRESENDYYFEYNVHGRKIMTDSNADWKSYSIDTLLGRDAVFISNDK